MTIRAACAALSVLLAVSACDWSVAETPLPDTATETRPSPAIETATLSIEVDSLWLLPAEAAGDWVVIGFLHNETSTGIEELLIQVAVEGPGGTQVAAVTTSTLMSNLAPGEAGPFTATFRGIGLAERVEAQVIRFTPVVVHRSDLEIEVLEQFATESGELALLGMASNPGDRTQFISWLGLVALGADSHPRALAQTRSGPLMLAPGEAVPFLALASGSPGNARWLPYHDAVQVEKPGPSAVAWDEGPRIRANSQGRPYVVGSLRNESDTAQQASVLLVLRSGDRILSLTEIRSPLPLEPGQRLAFAAKDFPGLSLRLEGLDLESLRVESRLQSTGAVEHALAMYTEVTAFHSVGSSIFIRGILRNDGEVAVSSAAVFAEIRSLEGELLTAGWFSPPSQLAPGEQTDFVIDLPLPEGTDPSELEYDLRALGVPVEATE